MKKLLLLFFLLYLSVFAVKAQNCGAFTSTTVCSQAPPGQQTNCCRCVGTQFQNHAFCGGTLINKGLLFLITAGSGIGSMMLKSQAATSNNLLS